MVVQESTGVQKKRKKKKRFCYACVIQRRLFGSVLVNGSLIDVCCRDDIVQNHVLTILQMQGLHVTVGECPDTIAVLPWPAASTDLSIEHIWDVINRRLQHDQTHHL